MSEEISQAEYNALDPKSRDEYCESRRVNEYHYGNNPFSASSYYRKMTESEQKQKLDREWIKSELDSLKSNEANYEPVMSKNSPFDTDPNFKFVKDENPEAQVYVPSAYEIDDLVRWNIIEEELKKYIIVLHDKYYALKKENKAKYDNLETELTKFGEPGKCLSATTVAAATTVAEPPVVQKSGKKRATKKSAKKSRRTNKKSKKSRKTKSKRT